MYDFERVERAEALATRNVCRVRAVFSWSMAAGLLTLPSRPFATTTSMNTIVKNYIEKRTSVRFAWFDVFFVPEQT